MNEFSHQGLPSEGIHPITPHVARVYKGVGELLAEEAIAKRNAKKPTVKTQISETSVSKQKLSFKEILNIIPIDTTSPESITSTIRSLREQGTITSKTQKSLYRHYQSLGLL